MSESKVTTRQFIWSVTVSPFCIESPVVRVDEVGDQRAGRVGALLEGAELQIRVGIVAAVVCRRVLVPDLDEAAGGGHGDRGTVLPVETVLLIGELYGGPSREYLGDMGCGG